MRGLPAFAVLLGVLASAAAAHQEGVQRPLEVWLDKPAQHRAGILTRPAVVDDPALRLPALVVVDPRRELRIAAVQDGVVVPAGGVLPVPGQAVRAGQVLAWLQPVLSQPERRDIGMDLALAQRDLKQGRIQIDRYGIDENQQLDVKLSTPSIEIITNYHSAEARNGELTGALHQPIPLIAPRAGKVLRSPALAGSVVLAGQALFEIEAPGALAAEADYADDDIDTGTVQQAWTVEGRSLPLRFLELSYDSALRVHRALYAVAEEDAALSVNQPLLLDARRTRQGPAACVLPVNAIHGSGGQARVWVHLEAEHFEARPVTLLQSPAAGEALVGEGLEPGARVVVAGAGTLEALARAGEEAP